MSSDDLIIAFYPCIYFCATSQMNFYLSSKNNRNLSNEKKIESILKRSNNRHDFFDRLVKFCGICLVKNIRMVFENPWSEQTFLKQNFIKAPDVVDNNRMIRGDFFKKPTAYWFFNCKPTNGQTFQKDKIQKIINNLAPNRQPGLCNEERSLISPDYARNWICDFILGKPQANKQLELF